MDVTCNNKLAEIARNYIKKGTRVLVEGFPNVNAYLSKENKPIGSLRVYAHAIELLSKKDETDSENQNLNNNKDSYDLPPIEDNIPDGALSSDDIPF